MAYHRPSNSNSNASNNRGGGGDANHGNGNRGAGGGGNGGGRSGPGIRRQSSLSSHHTSPQNQNQNQNRERSATIMGPPPLPPPPMLQSLQEGGQVLQHSPSQSQPQAQVGLQLQHTHPFAAQFGQVPILAPPSSAAGQGFLPSAGIIGPVYLHQDHHQYAHHHQQQPTYHSLHNAPPQGNFHAGQNRSPTHSHPHREFSNQQRARQGSIHRQYRRVITPPTPTSHSNASQTSHGQPSHSHPNTQSQASTLIVPEIIDRYSLQTAVRIDPDTAFYRINAVREERDFLQSENQRLARLLEDAKKDYSNAILVAERMAGVWREKQVLFWKYVERVRKEREGDVVRGEGDVGGGEWIGGMDEEELSAVEVERLWGLKLRRDFPGSGDGQMDGDTDADADVDDDAVAANDDGEEEDELQRGRSSEVTLRSLPLTRTIGQEEESEVVSLTEGSTMSRGSEPMSSEASLLLRLDPSARPFVPSPTRPSNREGNESTRNTFIQPKVLPAIPLNFSEALKRLPTPASSKSTLTPSKSTGMEGSRKGGRSGGDKRAASTSTKTSQESFSKGGGKKGNKAYRGGIGGVGAPTITMAERLFPQNTNSNPSSSKSTEIGYELTYPPPRKSQNKKGSRSPTKNRSPIRNPRSQAQTPSSDSTSAMRGGGGGERIKTPEPNPDLLVPRNVSPEVARVANLPAYPHELAIAAKKEKEAKEAAAKKERHKELVAEKEKEAAAIAAKEKQVIQHPTPAFLSRAKMNAALQDIGAPFNTVCPFSLLGNGECAVRSCSLLHVCGHFNSLHDSSPAPPIPEMDVGEAEREFPPLGSPVLEGDGGKAKERERGRACKDVNGRLVKLGEVCAAGKIHVLRSCAREIEGEECPFWVSPASSPTTTHHQNSPSKVLGSGSCGHAHPSPLGIPMVTVQSKEEHFALFAHERDGAGREAWSSRVKNAGLRSTHACGLWGVDMRFGVTGEEEEGWERKDKIEWKGKGAEESWKGTSRSGSVSVSEESPWRGKPRSSAGSVKSNEESSWRSGERHGSVVDEREWSVKGKGKGKGKDRFGGGEEEIPRGLKWEERKFMTREDWHAKGGWKK